MGATHERQNTAKAASVSIANATQRQISENANEIGDFSVVRDACQAVALPRVTVQEAFTQSFNALLKATGLTATAVAKRADLDSSTLTRWGKGERFPRITELERLRAALNVEPRDLFDPDAALSKLGLCRKSDRQTPKAHTTLDLGGLPDPESGSPQGGVALMSYENAHALAELLDQWRRLTPEARMSLVLESVRLAKAPGTAAAAKAR